ncbi:MAG: hypothetical protein ACJA1I_001437 [Zhongshania marina]|jgi:uncharacterized protein with NRDE domain
MCLILLSWQNDPTHALTVAANRDEFFKRPTLAANFWPEYPQILAGRDVEFGGSWLGISRSGRFAAVTNLREIEASGDRSRGDLVKNFLLSTETNQRFFAQLEANKSQYRPFNFIASDGDTLGYINNVETGWQYLASGIHAIGNTPLSEINAKTQKGYHDMLAIMAEKPNHQDLLTMLQDTKPTVAAEEDIYRALSCRFVNAEGYGTRSSSIVTANKNGQWDFWEQHYATTPAQNAAFQHFSFIEDNSKKN